MSQSRAGASSTRVCAGPFPAVASRSRRYGSALSRTVPHTAVTTPGGARTAAVEVSGYKVMTRVHDQLIHERIHAPERRPPYERARLVAWALCNLRYILLRWKSVTKKEKPPRTRLTKLPAMSVSP